MRFRLCGLPSEPPTRCIQRSVAGGRRLHRRSAAGRRRIVHHHLRWAEMIGSCRPPRRTLPWPPTSRANECRRCPEERPPSGRPASTARGQFEQPTICCWPPAPWSAPQGPASPSVFLRTCSGDLGGQLFDAVPVHDVWGRWLPHRGASPEGFVIVGSRRQRKSQAC